MSWLPIILVSLGILVAGGALLIKKLPKSYIKFPAGAPVENTSGAVQGATTISTKRFFIDISGAVENSGVYQIPDDSRIKNVLITAGGLSAKANRK